MPLHKLAHLAFRRRAACLFAAIVVVSFDRLEELDQRGRPEVGRTPADLMRRAQPLTQLLLGV